MKVKFWGTRGSIPVPEPDCMKYGGDTSCVEVRCGELLLILDAGTGIRKLGVHLMQDPAFKGEGHILISHSHWDHIQGFPFFRPAFVSGNTFHIYGAFKADNRLEDSLRGQMGSIYFPIEMSELPSSFHFIELIEQDFFIGDVKITSRALNHPGGCFGYRINDGRNVLVYATDTEPQENGDDSKLVELARNADLLIYDSQFTPEEYGSGKKGWGHSTWRDAVQLAQKAQVKRLVLFHHDPYHNDTFIDRMLEQARIFFPATEAASREMEVELNPESTGPEIRSSSPALRGVGTPTAPGGSNDGDIRYRKVGNVLVLYSPSDLTLFNSKTFQDRIFSLLREHESPKVLLNLGRLSFIDSSGIGSLAAVYEYCKNRGRAMSLCAISPQIREVLEITRFHLIMKIYTGEEQALKEMGR